jgi:NB-ARC domain
MNNHPTTPPSGNAANAEGTGNVAIVAHNLQDCIVATNAHLHLELPQPEKRLHQLPAPLPPNQFVGRHDESRQICDGLRQAGQQQATLLALKGMGGMGKTALAIYVAHQVTDDFPDAQLFLDLRGTTDPVPPAEAMAAVIRAFDPQVGQLPADPDALEPTYRGALAGKKALLVLDNARDAGQVRPLLPPVGCGLIVTSRYSLDSLDGVQSIALGELSEDEAVNLLRRLVPQRGTDDELKALAELCGYLPLALNVAGSFVKGHANWTLSEYRVALEKERLTRLKLGDDGAKDVGAVIPGSAREERFRKPVSDRSLAVQERLCKKNPLITLGRSQATTTTSGSVQSCPAPRLAPQARR